MTEAIWLTIGGAVAVTIVLSFGSLVLSDKGVRRLDRLRADKSRNDA